MASIESAAEACRHRQNEWNRRKAGGPSSTIRASHPNVPCTDWPFAMHILTTESGPNTALRLARSRSQFEARNDCVCSWGELFDGRPRRWRELGFAQPPPGFCYPAGSAVDGWGVCRSTCGPMDQKAVFALALGLPGTPWRVVEIRFDGVSSGSTWRWISRPEAAFGIPRSARPARSMTASVAPDAT